MFCRCILCIVRVDVQIQQSSPHKLLRRCGSREYPEPALAAILPHADRRIICANTTATTNDCFDSRSFGKVRRIDVFGIGHSSDNVK